MTNPSLPDFWAEKYQTEIRPPWDLGEAAPPLLEFLQAHPTLVPGRAAVVGCGLGHDACLFARHGFSVMGFDFVAAAVQGARQRAIAAGLSAQFLQQDVFELGKAFAGQFDYVVEHTCYCAIEPARRDKYVEVVWEILRPGGSFIGLFWAHDRPGGPPFGSDPAQIRDRFSTRFEIVSFELAQTSIPKRRGQEYLALFRRR